MLKYIGNLEMDEKHTAILNISRDIISFLEVIYAKNIKLDNFSVTIKDPKICRLLNQAKSEEERKRILIENKLMNSYYEKKLFNRLLGDFCQYMYEALRCIFEFKPQIAYTLARKPLIDDVFYLQRLYLNRDEAIDLVFDSDPKKKDVGSKNNKIQDKEDCEAIAKKMGFKKNSFFDIRYGEEKYSIILNCNKAMHISTNRQELIKTDSGELNFVFITDKEIQYYIKIFLDSVPSILVYVAMISSEICKRINGEDQNLEKRLEELLNDFSKIMS